MRQSHHAGDELGVALGELAATVVDVVLQPHPHMAAHGHSQHRHGGLVSTDPYDGPGGVMWQQRECVAEGGGAGGQAVGRPEHELEVRRRLQLPLAQIAQSSDHHADVEALQFELDARLVGPRRQGIEEGRLVEEHARRRVDGAGVEGRHLGAQIERCQTLLHAQVAPRDAAGREAEDGVGLGSERVDHFAEHLDVLRAEPGGPVADVDVQHGSPGPPGLHARTHYLVRGDGDRGCLLFGDARSREPHSDDELVHRLPVHGPTIAVRLRGGVEISSVS